jgi:hypothetical protein
VSIPLSSSYVITQPCSSTIFVLLRFHCRKSESVLLKVLLCCILFCR